MATSLALSTPAIELFLYRYIWIVLALFFYYIQTRRLRFKVIDISVSEDQFLDAARRAAQELGWQPIEINSDIVITKSSFSWRSWGELITIIRDRERTLINSICDPDNTLSVASWGMNKKNREIYERFVRDRT